MHRSFSLILPKRPVPIFKGVKRGQVPTEEEKQERKRRKSRRLRGRKDTARIDEQSTGNRL
jgi:hypothetical protein